MNHVIRNTDYASYLLRLWRDGASSNWRASLQSTATEQIHHFASIEALFIFLDERLCGDEQIKVLASPTEPLEA